MGNDMKKRRKIIIVIIAIIAAVWVLGVNPYFLYRYYQNYKKYGTILKPRYKEITKPGNVIVEAIYRYKAEKGLFPQFLDDLVPDYIEEQLLYCDGRVPNKSKFEKTAYYFADGGLRYFQPNETNDAGIQ